MNLTVKIKYLLLFCLIFLGLSPAFAQKQSQNCFKAGADRPDLYLPLLKNKNVAVVTNQTGLLLDKRHLVDFLFGQGITISKIFAPEHGFRGDADAGELVKSSTDKKTGISIVSLYGDHKKPTAADLKGVEVILFDIQDVGVRFYTYISTLSYVMEAAAESGVEVMVLDRPNPHDGYTDGPVLEKKWSSFVGLHPVPIVYGLTIGEYGKMVNGEKWLKDGIQVKYTLVPMQNYHKKQRYPMLAPPSPNLPNDKAINLYPSLCFFEGAEVSVGRGTDLPFQLYGSPFTKNLPFKFTPRSNYGAKTPPMMGEVCYGEDLSHDKKPLTEINLEYLLKAYYSYKNPAKNFFLSNLFIDKLAGTDQLRKQIISGYTAAEIKASWQKGLENFQKTRSKYIIYED